MKKSLVTLLATAAALGTAPLNAEITAKSYVLDGLVGQWDGKENAGYGTFNGSATSWVDLSGKAFSIPANATGWSWSDGGLEVTRANGTQVSSATYKVTPLATAWANARFTVEVAYEKSTTTPANSGGYNNTICSMLSIGQWQRNIGTLYDIYVGFDTPAKAMTANLSFNGIVTTTVGNHTLSCSLDGVNWNIRFNGTSVGSGSNAGTIAPSDVPTGDGLYLNRNYYQSSGLDGHYYSIRFYDHPLSADEALVNKLIDGIRFFGADASASAASFPDGWRLDVNGDDAILSHRISIGVDNATGGTITVDGGAATTEATFWIEQGSTSNITVSAVADEGYVFQGWNGSFESVDASSLTTEMTVFGDVRAVFRKTDGSDPRSYTCQANGAWGDNETWRDEYGYKGVPVTGDSATIPSGKSVVVTNATPVLAAITVTGTLTLTNWTACLSADTVSIRSGGIVTCGAPATTMSDMSRVWIKCGDLTVASGGKIDVDAKGYRSVKDRNSYGPGSPGDKNCAPSHGGFGAVNYNTRPPGSSEYWHVVALPYGNAAAPEDPGTSGAGSPYANTTQQHGGGAVKIEATGTVTINGSILASGGKSDHSGTQQSTSYFGQPGAGGSIFITCRQIAGSGALRANGGNCEWPQAASWALSAGGGRIAVHYDPSVQEGTAVAGMTISANCGIYQSALGVSSNVDDLDRIRCQGDMGTLHFTDQKIVDELIGKTLTGQVLGFRDYVHSGDLVFAAGRVRFSEEGARVSVDGNLSIVGGDARLEIGGGFATNCAGHVVLRSGAVPCELNVRGNLALGGVSRLDIRSAATQTNDGVGATVSVGGELSVSNGCKVVVWSDPVSLGSPKFDVGGMTVAEGGMVTASERGGRAKFSAGQCGYSGDSSAKGPGIGESGSGSGHGGRGGKGGTTSTRFNGGAVYGDALRPVIPGSGGVCYSSSISGDGGGRIHVSAPNGTIRIDGTVSADGEDTRFGDMLGVPGSGGSILLEANRFEAGATARLSASAGSVKVGGAGSTGSTIRQGASAGGRIAVWCGAPWSASLKASKMTTSSEPLGAAFSEYFSWSGTTVATAAASVLDGGFPLEDSSAEDGTVRFCFARAPAGMILLYR